MRLALLAASASVLTACAVTPPPALPPTHPASPQAAESPRHTASAGLAIDEATQTTASLLAPLQPGGKP